MNSRHFPMFRLTLLSLFLASPAAPSFADGFIYVEHKPISPPMTVPHPGLLTRPQFPLKVTRHQVNVDIQDQVARTQVDETFHNPNSYQTEGIYFSPLPPRASISNFAMSMNGKIVSGEVLEKDKARSIYESIVRQMKDPGLLEYVDRGLFRARVFPIPPGGNMDVRIAYDENLKTDHGHVRYHYPMDTGKYSAGDYQNVLVKVKIKSSSPIRNLNCSSHGTQTSRLTDTEATVTFEARTLTADRDFVLD